MNMTILYILYILVPILIFAILYCAYYKSLNKNLNLDPKVRSFVDSIANGKPISTLAPTEARNVLEKLQSPPIPNSNTGRIDTMMNGVSVSVIFKNGHANHISKNESIW